MPPLKILGGEVHTDTAFQRKDARVSFTALHHFLMNVFLKMWEVPSRVLPTTGGNKPSCPPWSYCWVCRCCTVLGRHFEVRRCEQFSGEMHMQRFSHCCIKIWFHDVKFKKSTTACHIQSNLIQPLVSREEVAVGTPRKLGGKMFISIVSYIVQS